MCNLSICYKYISYVKREHNISIKDLKLFNIVDTPVEAVEIIEEFYKKYTLKPNFQDI